MRRYSAASPHRAGGAFACVYGTAALLLLGCAGPPARAAPPAAAPISRPDPIATAATAIVAEGCERGASADASRSSPVPTWHRRSQEERGSFDVVVYTAHPDDEAMYAGGTMERLARANRRVAFVSASHGEGGRILERDGSGVVVERRDYPRPHVVAIRDREMAEAAHAIGVRSAHLYPADANLDFGWTESCGETLRRWDASVHGGVAGMLRRLVDDIRTRRPRVVVTLDPRDDPQASHHGHHKALGALAELAARLAADARAGEGTPHVVEELLTMARRNTPADVTVRVNVAVRLAMLGAYRSQFVPEDLAVDEVAQRPTESFVLRWRAVDAPSVTSSLLLGMIELGEHVEAKQPE